MVALPFCISQDAELYENALSKVQIALLYASFLRTDYLAILQCLDDINT